MAVNRLINETQGNDIIDRLNDIADNIQNIPYGLETSSDNVVAMTGYQKASTAGSISETDTLNEAIGKLEKKVDDSSVDDKVDGPDSATVGNIAVFDNIDGKSIDDSDVAIVTTVDDSSDGEVPTSKAIGTYISGKGYAVGVQSSTANNIVTFNDANGKALKDSGLAVATSTTGITDDDTKVPTSKSVKSYVDNGLSNKQDTLTFDGTYNASTNKAATVKTVTDAIEGLNVTGASNISAGKTIASWSEANGEVNITTQDISITPSQISNVDTSSFYTTDDSHLASSKFISSELNKKITGTADTVSLTTGDNTHFPTSKVVQNAIDTALSSASVYQGTIDAFNDLPTTTASVTVQKGWYYRVSTAWNETTGTPATHVGDIIIAEKQSPSKSIDGTNWSLLHNEMNTDANVAQSPVSTNADYEVLFSGSADNTAHTEGTGKDTGIKFNPSTDKLTVAGQVEANSFSGSGASLTNTLTTVKASTNGGSTYTDIAPKTGESAIKLKSSKGIEIAVDTTNKEIEIKHSHTDITPATSAVFKKVAYDAQGHITGVDNVAGSDLPSHSHTVSDITNFPTLGTAASKNVPVSGNASTTEVVMGDDSRLSTFGASGTNHRAGIVPDPGSTAGTTKYLREDGSWVEPTGDNLKLTGYEIGSQAAAVAATDTINEGIGKLEYKVDANQTNILSVEDMICDTEFSTSTAYAIGDIVTHEHGLYKFNTAHSAGAWNSSQVDEVTAVDLISSGSETDSVASKEIYVTKPINQPDTWETKIWTGLTSFNGNRVWTDGTNIYYSNGSSQYVLNKSTSTWETKTWTGLTSFYRNYIWTDGTNIYISDGSSHYVLNKSTSTWETKTWDGFQYVRGDYIWTDGTNIYISDGSYQYVLNKSTSTWSTKSWTGLGGFTGYNVWSDGENIYYSDWSSHYVLNKSTSTWSRKTWSGLTSFYGRYIWADGTNIYYSSSSTQYVLNKSTSTWETKTWSGLTNFSSEDIWTDGENVYYSSYHVLKRPLKTTKIPDVKNNAQLTALIGDINSVLEAVL